MNQCSWLEKKRPPDFASVRLLHHFATPLPFMRQCRACRDISNKAAVWFITHHPIQLHKRAFDPASFVSTNDQMGSTRGASRDLSYFRSVLDAMDYDAHDLLFCHVLIGEVDDVEHIEGCARSPYLINQGFAKRTTTGRTLSNMVAWILFFLYVELLFAELFHFLFVSSCYPFVCRVGVVVVVVAVS
jgi:hypothetical protein